jgi:hypothetical protein
MNARASESHQHHQPTIPIEPLPQLEGRQHRQHGGLHRIAHTLLITSSNTMTRALDTNAAAANMSCRTDTDRLLAGDARTSASPNCGV